MGRCGSGSSNLRAGRGQVSGCGVRGIVRGLAVWSGVAEAGVAGAEDAWVRSATFGWGRIPRGARSSSSDAWRDAR
jgi:hypothetical protein